MPTRPELHRCHSIASLPNDDNANLKYPRLDASIADTYAKRSMAGLKRNLYDSYVRAIRWASDRLIGSPQGGVVAFVTNGGYVDSTSLDGLRLTLADEFHHVYVFNLRGNQREGDWRREGGKIFDAGSMAGVAILLLVKQPGEIPPTGAVIHYRDIGDYLNRDDKLALLAEALPAMVDGTATLDSIGWATLKANEHGDWINQRSESFRSHMPAHSEAGASVFGVRTLGVGTNRDAWNFNSSRAALDAHIEKMLASFNAEADRVEASLAKGEPSVSAPTS